MSQFTEEIARAAAQDAGNRTMRKAGRVFWDDEDWNAACEEYNRLWPQYPVQNPDDGEVA